MAELLLKLNDMRANLTMADPSLLVEQDMSSLLQRVDEKDAAVSALWDRLTAEFDDPSTTDAALESTLHDLRIARLRSDAARITADIASTSQRPRSGIDRSTSSP